MELEGSAVSAIGEEEELCQASRGEDSSQAPVWTWTESLEKPETGLGSLQRRPSGAPCLKPLRLCSLALYSISQLITSGERGVQSRQGENATFNITKYSGD